MTTIFNIYMRVAVSDGESVLDFAKGIQEKARESDPKIDVGVEPLYTL